MSKNPLLRILAGLAMIAALAWAPWWAMSILALAFAWIFSPYYEIVLWGLVYDSLYGFHTYWALFAALAAFVSIQIIKPRVVSKGEYLQ